MSGVAEGGFVGALGSGKGGVEGHEAEECDVAGGEARSAGEG